MVPEWVSPLLKISSKMITDFKISDIFSVNGCRPFLWLHFIKSEIIKNNNLRINENLQIGEDQAFEVSYLSNVKKVLFCDKSFYRYRVGNPNSLMGKFDGDLMGKMWQHIEMINIVLNSLKDKLRPSDEEILLHWVLETMYWDMLKLLYYDQARYATDLLRFFKIINADKNCKNLDALSLMMYNHILIICNSQNNPDLIVRELTKMRVKSEEEYNNLMNRPIIRFYKRFISKSQRYQCFIMLVIIVSIVKKNNGGRIIL